jgi:hypothetical protein
MIPLRPPFYLTQGLQLLLLTLSLPVGTTFNSPLLTNLSIAVGLTAPWLNLEVYILAGVGISVSQRQVPNLILSRLFF